MTPKQLEEMAEGLEGYDRQPSVTPGEDEDAILTEVRRVIKTADGEPDQLVSNYAPEYLTLSYGGQEFAHYRSDPDAAWIEFRMYEWLHNKYAPDARFANVADKDQLYWRVMLTAPQQVAEYRDVIIDETL